MVNDNECDYYDTFLAPCQKVSFVSLLFPRPSIALCFPFDFISSLLSALLAPYFPGARFSKFTVTLRARNQKFKSKYKE